MDAANETDGRSEAPGQTRSSNSAYAEQNSVSKLAVFEARGAS